MRNCIVDEIVSTWNEAKVRKSELQKEHPDCEVVFGKPKFESGYFVRVYEDDRTGEDVKYHRKLGIWS